MRWMTIATLLLALAGGRAQVADLKRTIDEERAFSSALAAEANAVVAGMEERYAQCAGER